MILISKDSVQVDVEIKIIKLERLSCHCEKKFQYALMAAVITTILWLTIYIIVS